eukprot:jgi/Mesen1/9869/ME000070S09157
MVNKYYDLATSFYEYGWGQSFHFAHRLKDETLRESIKRHEHFLALRLGLRPGMKVGGTHGRMRACSDPSSPACCVLPPPPAFSSALRSGASVTGLNNNSFQISRGETLNRKSGHHKTCDFLKADFMKIPKEDASFDAVYEIEATCHAPDPVACYKEIHRVLKPGQCFAGYEWCLTPAYNPSNPAHQRCKAEIELGNGLPDIRSTAQIVDALQAAGFEVWALETVRLAPAGTYKVAQFLEKGADGLVDGGR